MRPLFAEREYQEDGEEISFHTLPHPVAWWYEDRPVDALSVGPINAVHWWVLPRNLHAIHVR